jgi:hypothetical protein
MSVSSIPDKVKIRLWGKAAGRCQYDGCNKPLWKDEHTKAEFNSAYIAHIIADSPKGPRGHATLSKQLKDDISNLMLMCDIHHRLIDKEDVKGHPVERLRGMKFKHENRIEVVTSIDGDKQSHIIFYGANIGKHNAPLSWQKAAQAMLPERFPAESRAIELSLKNSSFQDSDTNFWRIEKENLNRLFNLNVKARLVANEIKHFSVFALAPIPLLVEFGRLLSDIPAADVYQLHREPPNWKWQSCPDDFEYILKEPDSRHKTVAINLSLSATIDNETRISKVLNKNHSIWTLTTTEPNNDCLKSKKQLLLFRQIFRNLLNRIKAEHGEDANVHLFPAVPVSVAVEIGRVWMPKADLPIKVYDQNSKLGGFIPAIEIKNE